MKASILAWVVALVSLGAASANPADLSGGVLILHSRPSIEITNFCDLFFSYLGIETCEEQVTRVDPQDYLASVCYVVACWTEEKEWCQVEFGLGEWDGPDQISIITGAPCAAGTVITSTTSGWPGPNEGILLVVEDVPWSGNFQPVYWFFAYGYPYVTVQTVLPLTPHPDSGFAGTRNCLNPPQAFAADCLGALGINTDGVYCCPEPPVSVVPERDPILRDPATWATIKALYR